ncbi:dihydroneopterin aldolase [Dinghuibacter silviterrae]|uniref:7,8-dihydroneopterin aldolase n=1 Tax=Dinghuibacter silviterrae TaxID=1539049 RepID=A0A4R8DK20_9BACT|nr:dihydroneopterin aldolase [Dinghuibacter silviterrae]TDW97350.1 dihydroneopterin aldolase [Dinghuibacter silviterrae]
MTIHLENLRFYGYHGLYVHEQKLGAWFELDVSLEWPDPDRPIRHLHETVNYVAVYDLVKARMALPEELLETLAMEMAHLLKDHFPQLSGVGIRVTKINPPLLNFQGTVAVEYRKSF